MSEGKTVGDEVGHAECGKSKKSTLHNEKIRKDSSARTMCKREKP